LRIVKGLFSVILVFVISIPVYSVLLSYYSVEIDLTSTVTYIVDGDTFDITSGDRIRLADIDCPERGDSGFYEATDALSDLIHGRTVYLDIDDTHVYDTLGSRLVSLVYVEYDPTHYLNVNKALLELGFADVDDYPNEFNPSTWNLLVPKPQTIDYVMFLMISLAIGVVSTYIIIRIVRKMKNMFLSGLTAIKRRSQLSLLTYLSLCMRNLQNSIT